MAWLVDDNVSRLEACAIPVLLTLEPGAVPLVLRNGKTRRIFFGAAGGVTLVSGKKADSLHAWHALDDHLVSNSLSECHLTHMFSCFGDIPRSKRESAHIGMSMFPSSGPRLSMFVQWQEAGPPESLDDFSKASAGRAGFVAGPQRPHPKFEEFSPFCVRPRCCN